MKKALAKLCYRIIRKYIKVHSEQSQITLSFCFYLSIFGEKVSEIEYSRKQLVERMLL